MCPPGCTSCAALATPPCDPSLSLSLSHVPPWLLYLAVQEEPDIIFDSSPFGAFVMPTSPSGQGEGPLA